MVTAERFAQGLTLSQYLAQMRVNRERFLRAMEMATPRPGDAQVLARLPERARLLVITEDWCGTSLAYFPAVARLLEQRPDVEMRVFLRDANPDVMDQFLKRGQYRSIPVFAFFDESMRELSRFIETAPA